MSLNYYLVIFFASFIFCCLIVSPIRKFAIKRQILDHPDAIRKLQKTPVPYLGGTALLISICTFYLFFNIYLSEKSVIQAMNLVFLAPIVILGLIGLIDDLYALSPKFRLVVQTGIAFVTCVVFSTQNSLIQILDIEFLNLLLSTLWIVFVTNAINFIDNIDAAASGTVIAISIGLLIISIRENQLIISSTVLIILGSTLGFLYWNWPPAQIYLGDSGTFFLGSLLAIVSIKTDPIQDVRPYSVAIILMLFALPILDSSTTIISRISKKQSPIKSGRDHLAHRLIYLGYSELKTIKIILAINFYFVLSGLLVYHLKGYVSLLLMTTSLIFFILLAMKSLSIRLP